MNFSHSYAVIETAYRRLTEENRGQCILISGRFFQHRYLFDKLRLFYSTYRRKWIRKNRGIEEGAAVHCRSIRPYFDR